MRDLGEGGTVGRGVMEGGLRALGELKWRDWGLGGCKGTGVLGGTDSPPGPGKGPKELKLLFAGLDEEGAPPGEVTEYGR